MANIIDATRGTNMSLTTSAGTWVPFASDNGTVMNIMNTSDAVLEFRRDGEGVAIPIAANSERLIIAISNSADIEIRRQDSGAAVTIFAELFVV